MSIELHCHTVFSVDGRGTPEVLVETAARSGMTALAVTEHNHLGSLQRTRLAADRLGIAWIPGVEIDADWENGVHLLAFGFDPAEPSLQAVVDANQARYRRQYELFMELLAAEYCPLSNEQVLGRLADHYPTNPSPTPNLWFLRAILREQGIELPIGEVQQKIRDRLGEQPFGPMPTLPQVRDAVRSASGALLLAHVATYCPGDAERQLSMIDAALEQGLDGFELYHPANLVEPHFDRLAHKAEQAGCAVSGGSDCHNAAGTHNPLGCAQVPVRILETIERVVQQRRGG